jgi:hypothetical protein
VTVRELLTGTLRLIGAIASGDTPSSDDINDALSSFNMMAESWSADGLLISKVTIETFTISSGQQTKSIGKSSADWDTYRPTMLLNAGVMDGTNEIPIKVITADEWRKITDKSLQSTFPTVVYPEGTSPNETLKFWPIPSQNLSVVLYSYKPFQTFALDDELELLPGYNRAIKYNLAIELAPEWNKVVSPEIAKIAEESISQIKRRNTRPALMVTDAPQSNKRFNILTGE